MIIILIMILFFGSVFLFTLVFLENKNERTITDKVKNTIEVVSFGFNKINKPKGIYAKFLVPIIKKLSVINSRLKIEKLREKYANKLNLADLFNMFTPDEFIALKELSFLGGFLLYPIILSFDAFYMLVFGVIAFFIPDLWLKEKIDAKRMAILRTLPDTLDLLTLCVEAGLTFDASLNKVVEKGKPGPLKTEFSKMIYEVKIGKSRKDALKDVAKRVQITDFSSFVSTVVQSEKLGTSIGKALRTLSDDIRIKRRQRAEKLAMEAPIKLLFPLLVFIFPVVFIMLFGPIVLRLISTFR